MESMHPLPYGAAVAGKVLEACRLRQLRARGGDAFAALLERLVA